MKKTLLSLFLFTTISCFANLDVINEVANEALKEADIVIIGFEDDNKVRSGLIKGNLAIIQRYSLHDLPLKDFPEVNKVYAYSVVNGVFIDRPDLELKFSQKLNK
jgi:hypothetical protein